MIKRIMAYDIEPGVTEAEYDDWLRSIHLPDLFSNPYLRRVVFNTVRGPLKGTTSFYRISEMHFDDDDAYNNYIAWLEKHPIPLERSPDGRTAFRFYLLADSEIIERPDGA